MEYVAQMGEPWTFGLEPTAVDEFLTQRGFEVRSNFGPADLEQAYLMRSDGAPHGRVAEYIWIVHAAVG
jgi:O-methyltransferase involved in polyketide biosynthesis